MASEHDTTDALLCGAVRMNLVEAKDAFAILRAHLATGQSVADLLAQRCDLTDDDIAILRTGSAVHAAFELPRELDEANVADLDTIAPGNTVEAERAPAPAGASFEGTGPYQIEEELGRGGMGRVHRVRDLSLERDVAMKTLLRGRLAQEDEVQQLIREARITGQLEHPNIIPVHGLGTLPDGQFYYTMKLAREMTLADVLKRLAEGDENISKRYPMPRLLSIFQHVCVGIQHAHESGVVHRDLKPSNILIGRFGEVQVMDWGIAARTNEQIPPALRRRSDMSGPLGDSVQTPRFVGTPLYLAPEIIRGEQGLPDPRSDVYALGVILYEVLTLHRPFEAPTLDELAERILQGIVRPPRFRAPDRGIPEPLEDICLRALASDPEDRYPTALALWEALQAYVEGDRRAMEQRELAHEEVSRAETTLALHATLLRRQRALDAAIRRSQAASRPVHRASDAAYREQLAERDSLEIFVASTFARALDHFVRALAFDPDNERARQALPALYWSLLKPAAERADFQSMFYFGALIRSLREPTEGTTEKQRGRVSIRSFPEGAEIVLYDMGGSNEADSLAQPGDGRRLGTTPLMDLTLPAGIHVLIARAQGYRDTKYPLIIRDGEHGHAFVTLQPWQLEEPLLGRAREFEWVKRLCTEAFEARQTGLCLIHGAPGMGKTRLLNAFDEYLDSLPQVVRLWFANARRTHELLPFAPLADLVAFRAGIRREDELETIRAKIHTMVSDTFVDDTKDIDALRRGDRERVDAIVSGLSLLPGLANGQPAPRMSPEERRELAGMALRAYLARQAERWPVVIDLRNFQFFDSVSRAWVLNLRTALPDLPIFVLVSRTDSRGVKLDARALDGRFDHRIELEPLSAVASEWLLHARLQAEIAPRLAARFHTLSGGRPDHLEALAALLLDAGLLRRLEGRWDLPEDSALPSAIHSYRETVEWQLRHTLSVEELKLLQHAAVAGPAFTLEELDAMGVETPLPVLERLLERGVIFHHPTAGFLWTSAYSFAHDMVRRVCLESTTPEAALADHTALARMLLNRPQQAPEVLALAADHLEAAGRADEAAVAYATLADHAEAFAAHEESAACRHRELRCRSRTASR